MWVPGLLAVTTAALAALPVWIGRRRVLLNPALLVLVIALWSPGLKTLYVALSTPPVTPAELPGGATLAEFLTPGVLLALVAVMAYAASFAVVGRWTPTLRPSLLGRRHTPGRHERRSVAVLTFLAAAAFVGYLIAAGIDPFTWPLAAKRFLATDIGQETRFTYGPYYFFKAAMVSGSIAYASAYLLFRSPPGRGDRTQRFQFAIVFTFALFLSHFASLRLFILLVLVQLGVLMVYMRERRRAAFVAGFAALTVASFAAITFVHRLPALNVVAELEVEDTTGVAGKAGGRRVRLGEGVPPAARLAGGAFGGRYFLDVGKLSHIAHHFPEEHPYAMGLGYLGFLDDDVAGSRALPGGMSRYLAAQVLGEPYNSVPPGYAGELFMNFGWAGVVAGFLLLGAFHRLLYNYLTASSVSLAVGACLVLMIPSTTLVLLNSGLISATARAAIDLGVFLLVCPFWLDRGHTGRRAPRPHPAGEASAP